MLTLTDCTDIMDAVRLLFKRGHKSSNKTYGPVGIDPDLIVVGREHGAERTGTVTSKQVRLTQEQLRLEGQLPDTPGKHVRRLDKSKQAAKQRLTDRHVDMATAARLIDQGTELSGNCEEMAILAAAMAFEQDPSTRVVICSLTVPADHAFCLVADPVAFELSRARLTSIADLAALDPKRKLYIIDPWLHVSTDARNYLTAATETLKRWRAENKRIVWAGPFNANTHSKREPGRYPADNAVYLSHFSTAKLILKIFPEK